MTVLVFSAGVYAVVIIAVDVLVGSLVSLLPLLLFFLNLVLFLSLLSFDEYLLSHVHLLLVCWFYFIVVIFTVPVKIRLFLFSFVLHSCLQLSPS